VPGQLDQRSRGYADPDAKHARSLPDPWTLARAVSA